MSKKEGGWVHDGEKIMLVVFHGKTGGKQLMFGSLGFATLLADTQDFLLCFAVEFYSPPPPPPLSPYFLFLLTAWVQFILLSGDRGACECRETLVAADKPTLTFTPAGGTRFTKKTMSTRSHGVSTHMHNPHRPTPPENLPHTQINFNTYQQTVTMKNQCIA